MISRRAFTKVSCDAWGLNPVFNCLKRLTYNGCELTIYQGREFNIYTTNYCVLLGYALSHGERRCNLAISSSNNCPSSSTNTNYCLRLVLRLSEFAFVRVCYLRLSELAFVIFVYQRLRLPSQVVCICLLPLSFVVCICHLPLSFAVCIWHLPLSFVILRT